MKVFIITGAIILSVLGLWYSYHMRQLNIEEHKRDKVLEALLTTSLADTIPCSWVKCVPTGRVCLMNRRGHILRCFDEAPGVELITSIKFCNHKIHRSE